MFAQTIRDNLLAIAQTFCEATGWSMASVSKEFLGRSDLLRKIKQGERDPGCTQIDKILDRFGEEWPPGTPWPEIRPAMMSRKKSNR